MLARTSHGTAADKVAKLTAERPLILQIETTRSCNARCRFCVAGQPGSSRSEVLPLNLFERAVDQFIALGGQAISLTPVVGDPLVDPLLFERLELLTSRPAIRQLSFSTNGLALDRHSDAELQRLLRQLHLLQISAGGLEPASYYRQFGVDGHAAVFAGLERLLRLRPRIARPAQLLLALRLEHPDALRVHGKRLRLLRQRGVNLTALHQFHDFGGRISAQALQGLVSIRVSDPRPVAPCAALRVQLTVTASGRVGACNCVDVDAEKLPLGDLHRDSLEEIWHGRRRAELLEGFGAGRPPEVCCGCSSYQNERVLAAPGVLGHGLDHGQLPLGFYLNFFGG